MIGAWTAFRRACGGQYTEPSAPAQRDCGPGPARPLWHNAGVSALATQTMTETEFNRQVDATLRAIEDAVDASGADIDYDQQGGVLTLQFANGAKLIFSRQPPLRQLWLAAPSGGFHFDWQNARWQLAGGDTLAAWLGREASRLAGENLEFDV